MALLEKTSSTHGHCQMFLRLQSLSTWLLPTSVPSANSHARPVDQLLPFEAFTISTQEQVCKALDVRGLDSGAFNLRAQQARHQDS